MYSTASANGQHYATHFKVDGMVQNVKNLRDHSFITLGKYSEKLTFLRYHTYVCLSGCKKC